MAPKAAYNAPIAPTTVSCRKQEVVVLVARGLTNRQISEELFIPEHKIENHGSKILRKLELASRTENAAWATQQRLIAPEPE